MRLSPKFILTYVLSYVISYIGAKASTCIEYKISSHYKKTFRGNKYFLITQKYLAIIKLMLLHLMRVKPLTTFI